MAQEERLELRGKSLSFRMCLDAAKVVSATDAAVLLLGETGVGKEVMANYVHRHSGQRRAVRRRTPGLGFRASLRKRVLRA